MVKWFEEYYILGTYFFDLLSAYPVGKPLDIFSSVTELMMSL
jgi:hypothetical protein